MTFNILHISQSVNPNHGGPIEGIRQQAKDHALSGHVVEVLSLDCPQSSYLDFPGIPVYPLRLTFFDNFFPFSMVRWLRINYLKYDAIIINGIWGFHLFAAWLVLRNKSIPYFIFSHGMLDPWFRKRFPIKHLKKYLLWPWAIYPALRDADAVLFTCQQEKLLARNSFYPYECNEVVIDFGTEGIPDNQIDFASKFLVNHPTLSSKQLILFLGRVHPKKGPDLLIKAISLLQCEGIWDPSTMTLVMAGPTDGIYAKQLMELATKYNISDSIYWTGMLSGDQKWGAFQSADVFILPSHQENFGIAVAEALSCNIPVLLSTSVNIAPEIYEDRAGFVDSDTLSGTAELLRRWFSLSASDKATMRLSARKCFDKRFHISRTSFSIMSTIQTSRLQRTLGHAAPNVNRFDPQSDLG